LWWDQSSANPEEPIHLYAKNLSDPFELVVKHMSLVCLDLGNCSTIQLNAYERKLARESILRQGRF